MNSCEANWLVADCYLNTFLVFENFLCEINLAEFDRGSPPLIG
jgi:hypothetical protein